MSRIILFLLLFSFYAAQSNTCLPLYGQPLFDRQIYEYNEFFANEFDHALKGEKLDGSLDLNLNWSSLQPTKWVKNENVIRLLTQEHPYKLESDGTHRSFWFKYDSENNNYQLQRVKNLMGRNGNFRFNQHTIDTFNQRYFKIARSGVDNSINSTENKLRQFGQNYLLRQDYGMIHLVDLVEFPIITFRIFDGSLQSQFDQNSAKLPLEVEFELNSQFDSHTQKKVAYLRDDHNRVFEFGKFSVDTPEKISEYQIKISEKEILNMKVRARKILDLFLLKFYYDRHSEAYFFAHTTAYSKAIKFQRDFGFKLLEAINLKTGEKFNFENKDEFELFKKSVSNKKANEFDFILYAQGKEIAKIIRSKYKVPKNPFIF